MERKRRVTGPDGQLTDATEVGFRTHGEHWNEYLLDDGTVIRLKPVVTMITRVEGLIDEKGQPVYIVESSNVLSVSAIEQGEG